MLTQLGACELLPKEELEQRSNKLKSLMAGSGVDFAVITQNADLFYFTGSIQKGTFVIPLDGEPVIVSAKNISGYKLNYIQMLSELNQKELDFYHMEKIIMRDTYFSYTLLNYMNSAFFGFRDEISSIRQALVLLGEHEVRKWASLVILTFIGSDKPPEVTALSLVRARFCELLASDLGLEGHESELFIMGMFSLLDVLVGRPMLEILEKINLSENIKLALTDTGNRYRDILEMVLHYEKGEWDDFLAYANRLSADTTRIPAHYRTAIEWAEQILNSPIATKARNN